MVRHDLNMTIIEHLEELRRRLIIVFFALAVTITISFGFARRVLDYIVHPIGSKLVFVHPSEAFFAVMKLSVVMGIVLASPIILYQLLAFVLPALEARERRYLFTYLPAALFLFMSGAAFAYFIFVPMVFRFMLSFATADIVPMITIGSYVSFVIGLVLPFGLVFELPVIIFLLTAIGVVTPSFLRRQRRWAILAAVVVGAIFTPPDVVSQLMMAVPMLLLYEISIWLSVLAQRGRRRREAEAEES